MLKSDYLEISFNYVVREIKLLNSEYFHLYNPQKYMSVKSKLIN